MRPENPEGIRASAHEMIDHLKDYINTRVEILKLKAIDKSSQAIGAIALYVTLFLFFVLVLILASIGIALWLNQVLNNGFSGFFIVAGVYLLVAFVIYLGRDKLVRKNVANLIIRQMLGD